MKTRDFRQLDQPEAIRERFKGDIAAARRWLRQESKQYGTELIETHRISWEKSQNKPTRVLRSRDFMCQVFEYPDGTVRLSINRADLNGEGTWKDGITWDELQDLKREAGFGHRHAYEVYPADEAIIYDANMRHLFLPSCDIPPSWVWTNENRSKR